eukprot:g40386.t1
MKNTAVLLFLVSLYTGRGNELEAGESTPTAPACYNIRCPYGKTCKPSPKYCFTTPCPQYECVDIDEQDEQDVCDPNPCQSGQKCEPSPKYCFTTPCEQYECVDEYTGNACDSNPCPSGTNCKPANRMCIMLVGVACPQYDCEPSSSSSSSGACAATTCPFGYKCVELDQKPGGCGPFPCPGATCERDYSVGGSNGGGGYNSGNYNNNGNYGGSGYNNNYNNNGKYGGSGYNNNYNYNHNGYYGGSGYNGGSGSGYNDYSNNGKYGGSGYYGAAITAAATAVTATTIMVTGVDCEIAATTLTRDNTPATPIPAHVVQRSDNIEWWSLEPTRLK